MGGWIVISKGSGNVCYAASIFIPKNKVSKILKEILVVNLRIHWNLQKKTEFIHKKYSFSPKKSLR